MGRLSLVSSVSIESDLVFVWVDHVDLISVWGVRTSLNFCVRIEIYFVCLRVENYLVMVSGLKLIWTLCDNVLPQNRYGFVTDRLIGYYVLQGRRPLSHR